MKITDIHGTVKLANGVEMPYLGLGVFLTADGEEVIDAIQYALKAGYRHIDTAAVYNNEAGVGQAIKKSGVARKNLFLTSKVWNDDQGYDSTLKAFEASLERLQTDYLDLYLIHWPVQGKYKETWKALEHLYKEGKIRAIGVSNFLQYHLEDLFQSAEIKPMVNQMEFHPLLVQQSLLNFCRANQVQYEAWSPLMRGQLLDNPVLKKLAAEYGKTLAQVVLRWDLQKGVVTIPKSVHEDRIRSNAGLFDFELSAEDVERISSLDEGKRMGPDPDSFKF